jgi:hypothetical protein
VSTKDLADQLQRLGLEPELYSNDLCFSHAYTCSKAAK